MYDRGKVRFFFFSSRRRHTRCGRDWSSDVCSSDLEATAALGDVRDAVAEEEVGSASADVPPSKQDAALTRPQETGNRSKQGRLPRPIGTDHAGKRPRAETEVNPPKEVAACPVSGGDALK